MSPVCYLAASGESLLTPSRGPRGRSARKTEMEPSILDWGRRLQSVLRPAFIFAIIPWDESDRPQGDADDREDY
jgi:hypothetical protein